jgi:Peptidase_C39 like family
MLIFLLVALFGVALIIMLIGLYLSQKRASSFPTIRTQGEVGYNPRVGRGVSQGKRTRNVRLYPAGDEPYRRSSALVGQVGVELVPAHRLRSSTQSMGANDMVSLWGARVPRWLKLTLISGTIFSLCLFLFVQMLNARLFPSIAIITNLVPVMQSDSKDTTLYGENLGLSNASKSIVRIAQLDQSQYSSPDEYNQWAYSACSAASITEVINAYGHNYRITDILKVEAGLHEITPEQGLLESRGIDRTMAQFGFKMIPLQHATLDAAIAVANQGHPVIVSFANSGYWPGGHILVLRGGDAQNVELADSSRLNKTVVARGQFLQWWRGFVALAVPQ